MKRNCPQLKGNKESTKFCSYCSVSNHIAEDCYLKKKHEKEIQARREKFSDKSNLNSRKGRQGVASMTPHKTYRSKNVYSSASEAQTENLQTPQ